MDNIEESRDREIKELQETSSEVSPCCNETADSEGMVKGCKTTGIHSSPIREYGRITGDTHSNHKYK
jgi:hypothetical protein